MLTQINASEWDRMYGAEALCTLPCTVRELEQRFGAVFAEDVVEGLGDCLYAFVKIGNRRYFLETFGDRDDTDPALTLKMDGCNPNPQESLEEILAELGLAASQLPWIREDLSPPKWALIRQGDDGNEVEICRCHMQYVAEEARRRFEDRGHKQSYVVREITHPVAR